MRHVVFAPQASKQELPDGLRRQCREEAFEELPDFGFAAIRPALRQEACAFGVIVEDCLDSGLFQECPQMVADHIFGGCRQGFHGCAPRVEWGSRLADGLELPCMGQPSPAAKTTFARAPLACLARSRRYLSASPRLRARFAPAPRRCRRTRVPVP